MAEYLIRSLDTDVDEDAEAKWREELQRRAEAIDTGTTRGKPASVVIDELQRKHS
ncbi:MAG: hypothetical protein DWQ34_17755 [Planctomycetota bacterium]|nr:MAG: hypothetical protein DWQ29_08895 [Planctomycetota bacterium]REJ90209.1 MAG: hypothetical protein DWQ34_17755 [Planctomycetota bacterium]REK28157.1 MAG: hypothetical protein DWQ41_06305 [Planctomycetota bacterium]REK36038.1 MAG: hypothetical protein DWQ45_10150 [Planctomycetota bacterium]